MAFRKGKSGNPQGRPKGIPDSRTKLRKLLDPHADALVKKAVDLALEGDSAALRLCLDRCMAPIRAKDEPVQLGTLKGSLTEQGKQILAAITAGKLTPAEGTSLLQALGSVARVTEVDELIKRIEKLEGAKHG